MGGGGNPLKSDNNGDLPHPDTQESTTYTFKTYEDYFIDNFNLPEETYTRDETTGVVTINYSNIKRTTANGETKLSYNGNVFYTVTSQDLTGTGSQTDPYIVNSLKGFLYLSNDRLGRGFYDKFVKLNCDIVLNEEIFDKNGNPSGGDGVVYSWPNNISGYALKLDGNGNSIIGVYHNNPQSTTVTRFLAGSVTEIKNINFINTFLSGRSEVYGLGNAVKRISNVNMYGTIMGSQGSVSAFVVNAAKISDCKNYAEVHAAGNRCSGFVLLPDDTEIRNCKNYGNIYGAGIIGGIAAFAYMANCDIIGCVNYGNITSSADQSRGGIIGIVSGVVNIINCANYGNIYCKANAISGGLIGQIINSYGSNDDFYVCANIKNTKIELDYNFSNCSAVFAYMQKNAARKMDVNIDGLIVNVKNADERKFCGMSYNPAGKEGTVLNFKNIVINAETSDYGVYYFFEGMPYELKLKNVIVMGNCSLFNTTDLNSEFYYIDGYICFGSNTKLYIGENFANFYFSWRTGKIGLVTLDGRGSFQGKIDEDWLLNKGFEKKVI